MPVKSRPVFPEIPNIRLSTLGIVSILRHISGVILFIMLPVPLYLLSDTLSHEPALETYRAIVSNPLVKSILTGVLWVCLHHLLAGVRSPFLDTYKGLELNTTRSTAKLVFVTVLVLTVVLGVLSW